MPNFSCTKGKAHILTNKVVSFFSNVYFVYILFILSDILIEHMCNLIRKGLNVFKYIFMKKNILTGAKLKLKNMTNAFNLQFFEIFFWSK